jgi:hypothetical protein
MRWKTVALLFALAALIAGCGSDNSSSDSSSSTALTKSEFLKQGNAICAKGNKEINQAQGDLGPQSSQADIEAFVTDTIIPSIQGQVDDLRALTPPAGDEQTVDEILTAAEDGLAKAKQDPASLTGGGDPFAKANKLATDYGLTACGAG